jgi:hypothetical protein
MNRPFQFLKQVTRCSDAAEFGHLEVMRWARERGCPWDAATALRMRRCGGRSGGVEGGAGARLPVGRGECERAAAGGHLEVLKWARENACPSPKATRDLAAMLGFFE